MACSTVRAPGIPEAVGLPTRCGKVSGPPAAGVSSFIHVKDAARAAMLAIDWPAGVVNIVDDEPAAGTEWLPHFATAIGAPSPPMGEHGGEQGASNRKARQATRVATTAPDLAGRVPDGSRLDHGSSRLDHHRCSATAAWSLEEKRRIAAGTEAPGSGIAGLPAGRRSTAVCYGTGDAWFAVVF